jgi:hypothetical protein
MRIEAPLPEELWLEAFSAACIIQIDQLDPTESVRWVAQCQANHHQCITIHLVPSTGSLLGGPVLQPSFVSSGRIVPSVEVECRG